MISLNKQNNDLMSEHKQKTKEKQKRNKKQKK